MIENEDEIKAQQNVLRNWTKTKDYFLIATINLGVIPGLVLYIWPFEPGNYSSYGYHSSNPWVASAYALSVFFTFLMFLPHEYINTESAEVVRIAYFLMWPAYFLGSLFLFDEIGFSAVFIEFPVIGVLLTHSIIFIQREKLSPGCTEGERDRIGRFLEKGTGRGG